MSKRNGGNTRAPRQKKQKTRQRNKSRKLSLPLERKTAAPSPDKDAKQIVSSQLRQLIVNGKADPNALEIVVYRVSQGE